MEVDRSRKAEGVNIRHSEFRALQQAVGIEPSGRPLKQAVKELIQAIINLKTPPPPVIKVYNVTHHPPQEVAFTQLIVEATLEASGSSIYEQPPDFGMKLEAELYRVRIKPPGNLPRR